MMVESVREISVIVTFVTKQNHALVNYHDNSGLLYTSIDPISVIRAKIGPLRYT